MINLMLNKSMNFSNKKKLFHSNFCLLVFFKNNVKIKYYNIIIVIRALCIRFILKFTLQLRALNIFRDVYSISDTIISNNLQTNQIDRTFIFRCYIRKFYFKVVIFAVTSFTVLFFLIRKKN